MKHFFLNWKGPEILGGGEEEKYPMHGGVEGYDIKNHNSGFESGQEHLKRVEFPMAMSPKSILLFLKHNNDGEEKKGD